MGVGSIMSDLLDKIDAFPDGVKISICVILVIASLFIAKYAIIRPWWKLVRRTEADWDDHLHKPLANRLNLFVIITGLQLSLSWILEPGSSLMITLAPVFAATYILLTTTIASVSVKHLVPVIMEQFQEKGSVTVSGSNSIVAFTLRFILYFAGLYFALGQLGIELFGILASLAVFSLIIGLAIQQTLGNIVNSFLLSIDRPFEVGDRIEIDTVIGSVASVGILSTKVLDRDERLVVIPNNTLVQSNIINHARGGGDGVARRISVVIDIGVDYRESVDHVKYTLLKLARLCPYTISNPEPRVLLNELGDFSKMFRLYTWVADYSEEWVARDWLLKNIDETFSAEDINIPFPTAVEIMGVDDTTDESRQKAKRQQSAKAQMTKEDKRLKRQRDAARKNLEAAKEKLKDAELTKAEITELEDEVRKLENELNMFDTDDD